MDDFLEHAKKEQEELNESMKESFRQRDERKANEINMGNVNFLKEGKFILCSKWRRALPLLLGLHYGQILDNVSRYIICIIFVI